MAKINLAKYGIKGVKDFANVRRFNCKYLVFLINLQN